MQWNSALYQDKHAFVFKYGEDVVQLLAPQAGERILDVGCGTGHLSNVIAHTGAKVVGIDNSADMIASATASFPGVTFQVADAADFNFFELFDAIFSNAALHWVRDAEGAVICMSRALKSGGRFVVEMGGNGNIEKLTRGIGDAVREVVGAEVDHGRHYPSISEYTTLLERHGMVVSNALLFDRPTVFADGELGLRNWINQFEQAVLRDFSSEQQVEIIRVAEGKLRDQLFRDGNWVADYKRLRIVAHKR
ncbi:MAG: methyltransferase family protein [Verrucomicrobiaceae bacterium]|nr:methyltransferase family protein [Verrucomicrobiaceae bacterium]